MNLLYMVTISLLFTAVLMPLVIKVAVKLNAVDVPEERKVHTKIKPRLGGMGIYLGFLLPFVFSQSLTTLEVVILIGASWMFLLGVFDDLYGLSAKIKFLVQLVIAVFVVSQGYYFQLMPGTESVFFTAINLFISVIWIVGVTNAINLIDGLDGLAAGISAIAILGIITWGVISGQQSALLLAIALVGSISGFLFYNIHPAKIFMGDSGSLFLGYMVAVLAIINSAGSLGLQSIMIPILILAIPIADTILSIIRRLLLKQSIFQPDKNHFHHQLLKKGLTHRVSVVLIWVLSFCFGMLGLILSQISQEGALAIFAVITVLIIFCADKIGVIDLSTVSITQSSEVSEMKDKTFNG